MKRILAYLLTFALIFSSMPAAFAEEGIVEGQTVEETTLTETIDDVASSGEETEQSNEELPSLEEETQISLMSDGESTDEIVYEEITAYADYVALKEQFYAGEDFSNRYFKVSGEIMTIAEESFAVASDEEDSWYKIYGSIPTEYLNYNATVYCSTYEAPELDYFLSMTDIEYGEMNIVEIFTEEDLAAINPDSTQTYELKDDIVLSEDWTPIEFSGVFEGNDYTISNLNVISDQEYSYDYAGLFSINNGTIKNLNVETAESGVLSLRGETATAGIIVGLNNGTIENCNATGFVAGLHRAGGIVGNNAGTVDECYADVVMTEEYSYQGGLIGYNSGVVSNSHTLVDITASNYIGGLIGESYGGEISNCYSEGTVSGSNYLGGLVGCSNTPMTNCYSECNVIGNENVGGLNGYLNAELSNCHSTGSVVGYSNYIGGLVGRTGWASFSDSYFTGSVKSNSSYVGGIIGQADYTTNLTDCYARATIQGYSYIGGLIGYSNYSANIVRCYTGGGIIANGDYAGGLVGRYYAQYSNGQINNSFSNADVWGSTYVGGLIGRYAGGNTLTAENNYSTGSVDGVNYVGGLVGYQNPNGNFYNSYAIGKVASVSNSGGITGWRESVSSALIEKCYYDIETTGMDISENGIGKTTSKMKTADNYLTWDFNTVWAIDSSINNGYPYLRDNYNTNEDSTIIINNEEDLRAIANNLSGNYILNDNIELTEDWSTVGDSNLTFYGTFDGNGYTISNFNMNEENSAFIHSIAVSGVVKNLNIEIGTGINATSSAAGIAINNYGTIDNCTVSGKITNTGDYTGGIVATNYAEVNNCHTKTLIQGGTYTGGIIGYLSKGNLKGSSAVGSAVGTKYVGGAVGYMAYGSVSTTATAGLVRCTDTSTSDQATGGLIGYCHMGNSSNSYTPINECYSTAYVSGYYNVGGFIGRLIGYGNDNEAYTKYITNSYSVGNVNGLNRAGSFVGYSDYRLDFVNCYTVSYNALLPIYRYAGGTWTNVDNCYFSSENNTDTLFEYKTNTELKEKSTFVEWDFENVWDISTSVNNGMPYLKNAPVIDEEDTFILIQTEDDLANISNDLTAKYKLATDITITSDWSMIGTTETPFVGMLDGNGFTITNKTADDNGTVYPIFNTIGQGGVVKNIVVDTAVDTTNAGTMAAGIAFVNNGNIEGITVKGSVKGSIDYIGGIVAQNNGTIYNTHSEASVEGVNYVGGIAGLNTNSIIKSSSKGKIVATGTDAGGLVGRFTNGSISQSFSHSSVYGNSKIGGLVGYMENLSYISYSYSKGEVGSVENAGEYFGGIVGYAHNCGELMDYVYSSAKVKGYNYVGGLAGYIYTYDRHTYVENCYVDGEVAGNEYVGSLMGRVYGSWHSIYLNYIYSAAKCGGCETIGYCSGNFSASYCYFNSNNAGKTYDSWSIALTDAEFKDKTNFENWDFDTIWDISAEKNNGYPYLRVLGTDDYSVEDTYEYTLIHNEEELFQIKKDLNGKYKLANDIEIKDSWQPIGNSSKPFNGILDGNGYKIYNFHVLQNEEYEYELAGLFGYIGRLGEVRNLTVETTDYGVATLNSGKYAGIITADNYGKIDDCHVVGNVKATDIAGGVAARNYGTIINSSANVTVTNSSYVGAISGYNSGNIQNSNAAGEIVSQHDYVGGITGYNDGYVNACITDNIVITGNNYVGGIVGHGGTVYKSSSKATINGYSYVGGISGRYTTISSSTAECEIKADGERIGGIIGENNYGVSDSFFKGSITGKIDSSYYIGGIAGYSSSTISNCTANANISGYTYIGGIVGDNRSTVENVSATGAIIGSSTVGGIVGTTRGTITNAYSDNSISGKYDVGGFAGNVNGTITYGYSLSDVNGVTNVGGFVGSVNESGNITLCFAKGNIVGSDYVGGFAGTNNGYLQYNYSIGKVTGSGDNVGGFLGSLTGRILNSYYNTETSGQSDTGKGIPKTSEQMKKESIYVGWDFETVWKLQSDVNSGYPYFDGYEDKETDEEIVIEISDKEGFYAIANNPDGNYKLTADIELDETISTLGGFSGTLDGDGHKIYGFSMNIDSGEYVGLFEDIRAGGIIKNLTVEYENITIADDVTASGALAGRNFGTIINCTVNGNISGKQNIGGIVGYNYSVIENSTVSGNVSGDNYVGGIVARNFLNIENCQSKANVYGNSYVGGIAGYDDNGYIKLSSSTGNIYKNGNYTSTTQSYVGGLVGYANYTHIDRCLTSNVISGGSYVGGITGYDSHAVITMSSSSSAITGSSFVGGFVGNSYYSTISDCYSTGSVNGYDYVGGFAGYEDHSTIQYSYANCDVVGTGGNIGGFIGTTNYGDILGCVSTATIVGNSTVGGFIGYNDYVKVTNCYANGILTGNGNVGGFIGYSDDYGTFENCATMVKISNTNNAKGFVYYNWNNTATFTNCYYDATNNSYSDSYATGKTAEELAEINQYKNWDFEANWILNKDVSEYPYLAWQKAPGDLPTVIPTVSVEISSTAYAVNVGEALSMQVSLFPANATDKVVWSSSNENVAVVKADGTVVAISEGRATITATAGTATASVEIDVVAQDKSGNIVKVITVPEFTVPYDTEIDEMLVMLPNVVEVMLSTGVVASLEVTWRHTADTEYEFSGAITIPDNINITNTNNISATATVTKEPEAIIAKEIISVPDVSLGVVNGTSLSTVLSMLPESVDVTLDDDSEVSVSVAWSETSEPYYNAFTGGEYVFTGKIVLPGDNSIKNTNGFSIIGKIKVAGEEVAVRNITSAMAQNNILIESYTTLNDVLELFPDEVYAVVDNVQTVSIPVTWSSISEPTYSPRVAGTYTFYGAFILPDDGTITNTLNIRPTINVVVSSTVSDEKAITVIGSTAEIGKSTTVSVVIDENTKMASGSIVIDYDATLLTPVSYEIGSVIEETSAMVNINYIDPATQERKVKVSWVGANEINAGGELVKISFLVSEGTADETQIEVGVEEVLIEDMDLNIIPCKTIAGKINAVSVMLGDVNSDGKISIQDAFRILLMDIGRITFTDKQKLAADVNKDGVIDIFDAMKIQKYDIGLSDTLN